MRKELELNDAYVTCLTCDLCYDDRGVPTFCQRGKPVDPRNILENMNTAAKCKYWFPKVISRSNASLEYSSGDRWYEKDSMA